ncbi:MAG: hypothetical protein QM831_22045 [Kofleriaceae bacterium]
MHKPQWWTDKHEGTWDRIKDAMKRDWEQTQNDFSSKKGEDLNQGAADTIKQAAGKEPIPPITQPNWEDLEDSYRFGAGARDQYATDYPSWNEKLEGKLSHEWSDLKTGKDWDSVKAHVKRAWHAVNS